MKSLILIFFIIGVVMITKGYMENYSKCPLPTIECRYIPRNFYEEQITETNVKNTYSDMFNKSCRTAWSKYPNNIDDTSNTNNSNFISSSIFKYKS